MISDEKISHKGRFLNSKRLSYALIAGFLMWIGWFGSFFLGKGNRDVTGQVLCVDYLAFYTGGKLVASGQSADLYNLSAQQEVQQQIAGKSWSELDIYLNPPFYTLLFVPFALISYKLSICIWLILQITALWLSLKTMGARNVRSYFLWAITFLPVFSAISFGQNTSMSLLLLSITYILWRRNKLGAAGLVCSLLLYKPQLILGIVVLWIFGWRKDWKALTGLALGGLILVILSFSLFPEASRAYITFSRDILPGFATWPGYQLWEAHTPRAFWQLLLPGFPGLATGIYGLCAVAGLAGYAIYYRRFIDYPGLQYAGAIGLTVWLTPHMFIYDWTILLIPAVLLLIEAPQIDWKGIFALVWVASFISGPITAGQLKFLPWAIQISVPILLLSFYLIYKRLNFLRITPIG